MKPYKYLTIGVIIFFLGYIFPVTNFATPTNFNQEIYPLTECNDGIDNDGDGGIDFATDPQCTSWLDLSESEPYIVYQCNDNIDNDGDGLIDFGQDLDCESIEDDNELTDPIILSGPITPSLSNVVQENQITTLISETLAPVQSFVQTFLWKPLGSILGIEDSLLSNSNSTVVSEYLGQTFIAMTLYLGIISIIGLIIFFKIRINVAEDSD